MKSTVVLPLVKETKGTVVYALPVVTSAIIGQVYVRKEHLQRTGDAWPSSITITVETGA